MKRHLFAAAITLVAASLMAADSSPKDDATAAAKKLGDNYSWKTSVDLGPNAQFGPLTSEGKMAGDTAWFSQSFGDNSTEGIKQGTNVVIKGEEGWQSASEVGGGGGGGGGFNPAAGMVRNLQNLKGPGADLVDAISKTKDMTMEAGAYTGALTDDGAKDLATFRFGGRRGGAAPKDAKGTLKVWVKDGAVSKYELKVSGKRTDQNGDEQEFERTTTVNFNDVGSTKITIPDDAKKKLS